MEVLFFLLKRASFAATYQLKPSAHIPQPYSQTIIWRYRTTSLMLSGHSLMYIREICVLTSRVRRSAWRLLISVNLKRRLTFIPLLAV
jgi:hypothetical protein